MFLQISNPRYADPNNVDILLDVVLEDRSDEVHAFLAKANDVEHHGVNLFCRASTGEFGPISPYKAPMKELPAIKQEMVNMLEQELFKRLPVYEAFRRGVDAINAAATERDARAAFAAVKWPEEGNGNGINR